MSRGADGGRTAIRTVAVIKSDPRLSEVRCTRSHRRAAQIEQPGQGQADRVEAEINDQRGLRAAGRCDRLAEAARDEVAAHRTDRADEPAGGTALDASGPQRGQTRRIALAFYFAQVFLTKYRGNHAVGRAVADAGGD